MELHRCILLFLHCWAQIIQRQSKQNPNARLADAYQVRLNPQFLPRFHSPQLPLVGILQSSAHGKQAQLCPDLEQMLKPSKQNQTNMQTL